MASAPSRRSAPNDLPAVPFTRRVALSGPCGGLLGADGFGGWEPAGAHGGVEAGEGADAQ